MVRDDILVMGYGDSQEEAVKDHDDNLVKLLQRARQANLKLNKSKMNLRKPKVSFMGHVITSKGLKPDPKKVKAVEEMPRPTSKKELSSLLGFVNYLSKFLPRLAEVAKPLRELTSKEARFLWSPQHETAFSDVKQLVVNHPVLKFYDPLAEVTLQCDASEYGLGATLLQDGQPVAFASRTLSPNERNYAQIEKECLAIVFGCQRFDQYLARKDKITVESDHKPLQAIFLKPIHAAPRRLQRMLLRLLRYNLAVQYKKGSQTYLADHLSRAPVVERKEADELDEFQVFALEVENLNPFDAIKLSPGRLEQLQTCTAQDPVLLTLKTTVITGWPEVKEQVPIPIRDYWLYRDEISVHNGVLFKNHRVIIPKLLREEIMSRIHSSHLGIESCRRKARVVVFWPGMNSQIKEIVSNCHVCAEFQARNPRQPLQTHEIPERPWSRFAADLFILHGKSYIALVDYFSDFIEVAELPDTTSSSVIQFVKEQYSRHGIPDCLVTDNGSQIVSQEFMQFATDWEFKHVTSSPRYPRSNGKAESAVKIFKSLFKKAFKDNRDPWLALLDYLMSRRTRTLLPTATSLLQPKVLEGVNEKIKVKKQKAKYYQDRTARTLPEIEIGQEVRVAPQERNQPWKSGTCVKKLSDRSYLVETSSETLRRNR